jgi:hypothetical protein
MTGLTNPSSLSSGSQGQADLGSLLTGLGSTPDLSTSLTGSSADPTNTSIIPTSSGTTPSPSLGTDISNLISGFSSSGLGNLATFGGLATLGISQANSTAATNTGLAQQISAIGAPDVSAGQSLLSAYTGGNLTAPFQAQVTTAQQADALSATSQEQQVASLLANSGGGQNIGSAAVSETGQIQNRQAQLDAAAVSNAFQAELSASLGLTGAGGAFVQSGIQQEIASNTQLQGQITSLLAMLASAYSAGGANGTSTTGASSLGSTLGSLGNAISTALTGASQVAGLGGTSTTNPYAGLPSDTTSGIVSQGSTTSSGVAGDIASSTVPAPDVTGPDFATTGDLGLNSP